MYIRVIGAIIFTEKSQDANYQKIQKVLKTT